MKFDDFLWFTTPPQPRLTDVHFGKMLVQNWIIFSETPNLRELYLQDYWELEGKQGIYR